VAGINIIGESPNRKLLISVWVIGISGILVTRCLYILESRTSKPQQGGRCHYGPTVSRLEKEESSIVQGTAVSLSGFRGSEIP
jgi:hypothetical protein